MIAPEGALPPAITVERFWQACAGPLSLALVGGRGGLSREISEQRVQKAGLGLTGEVDSTREGVIQILGDTETSYLDRQDAGRRAEIVRTFLGRPMACIVVGNGWRLPEGLSAEADARGTPLFVSPMATAVLIPEVLKHLARLFAESSTIHGVLVDVVGVGVLLLGDSGIGKSECALDLILRGHRFVADDVIHLEKRGPETLLGSGSDLTRHHMEVRGLGIINIRDLFGLSAISTVRKVELVIQLEAWRPDKEYDRLGLEERQTRVLGVPLPTLLIPVSSGRNLATIVEVAVRNHLLKGQGVYSARDLAERQGRRAEGNIPP